MADAEKIFVVWRAESNLTEDEVMALWGAMRARGPGQLLWIVKEEPSGMVQEINPGLMRGTIDRWMSQTPDVDKQRSVQSWLNLLVNTWKLHRPLSTTVE
jgi:hypothetical protein